MVIGTIFQANLNADKIYIDLTYLPDPIKHKFWLTIKNQSVTALYFKVISNIANWTVTDPTDGKLGSVAGGSETTFAVTMTRANPGVETVDSGTLVIEAYTDSGYTNKVAEDSLSVTVYIEDLEAWPDVQKFDFEDGSDQGWSGGTVTNEVSVEVGGYSYRSAENPGSAAEKTISRSITLPNRNNVRLSFFLALKNRSTGAPTLTAYLEGLRITIDDIEVFNIPIRMITASAPAYSTGYSSLWIKVALDLSSYKGQTKTVNIIPKLAGETAAAYASAIFDRIVVAGKD